MERFGRLDVLFNNAGIVPVGSLVDCTEEQWRRTIDVNIGSMYLLSREAVPLMVKQGGGCIINMGAVAGLTGVQNRGAYSVSKSAVIGLTKSLAADFIKDGLRVNCICPATVDTPSMRQRVADTPDPDATRRAFVARQPMGRLGTAEEIAALALYLASEDSRFMTGQAVVIDGGMMMSEGIRASKAVDVPSARSDAASSMRSGSAADAMINRFERDQVQTSPSRRCMSCDTLIWVTDPCAPYSIRC